MRFPQLFILFFQDNYSLLSGQALVFLPFFYTVQFTCLLVCPYVHLEVSLPDCSLCVIVSRLLVFSSFGVCVYAHVCPVISQSSSFSFPPPVKSLSRKQADLNKKI